MWTVNAMTRAQNPGKKGENIKKFMETLKTWLTRAELKQSMAGMGDLRGPSSKPKGKRLFNKGN